MTYKAYIVANEQQEQEVLDKLESQDIIWKYSLSPKTTQFIPSHYHTIVTFPYLLKVIGSTVSYGRVGELDKYEIVYDGRKEEQMSEKYVVSQVFMNKLKGWKHDLILEDAFFVNQEAINNMPKIIKNWWVDDCVTIGESNKRLISIIRYMSGANDFEIEKPKKWVVRSKEPQGSVDGEPLYIWFVDELTLETETEATMPPYIRRFNTKEEAQEWANSHQEVVEVEE